MTKNANAVRKQPRKAMRDRPKIKRILEDAFRKEFPNDTVDISDGYQNNIHILVVSRRFDAINAEKEKQDLLWEIIDKTNLNDAEKGLVSFVLPVSPALLK
jgi:hypothetical protein